MAKEKSIFRTLSLILLSIFFILNNISQKVYATENLPEVTIHAVNSGLKVQESNGDYKRGDNILTKFADVFLEGNSMYTSDSKTGNDLNGTDPGKTMTGEMGCILKTEGGEQITSLNVSAQLFINTNKEGVINKVTSSLGGELSDNYKAELTKAENLLSSTYGEYLDTKYTIEIKFDNNGNFSFQIPENIPNNYILAFTEVQNPETGEMINITEYWRLFLAVGDASNSNPGKPTPKPETPDKSDDDGRRYYSINTSRTSYKDLDPEIVSSISSEKYNVETAIPTSENLTYKITADNALYDIESRKIELKAGVRNITIKVSATYPQKHTSITYDKKTGKKKVEKWTTIETVTKTVTTSYSYSLPTITLYDVPKSNIYPVQSGSLQAENTGHVLSSGTIGLTGSSTRSPQTLGFSARMPSVSNVETQNLGHYSSHSAAKKAVDGSDGGSAKKRIQEAVHAAVSYSGSINYSYYGLHVTTKNHNGVKPIVAKTSGSSTHMIPSNYPNGLYTSSGNVIYAGAHKIGTKPNNVVVHTPVVNSAYISWISDFVNQKISKDSSRKYLMLDEDFTITIPNGGTHNNFKGYGNRTYNSGQGVTGLATTWGKIKDVKLPFDVYLHYKKNGATYKYFVKANTWLSESGADSVISLTGTTYTFTVPVWVTEKTYDIETRVIAENATNYALTESNINSSIYNYVATKTIPVEVIGKIYDLRISASTDPGWQDKIYSQTSNLEYIKAEEFPFGQQGQNKVTQYKYAPKLGYSFVFEFKTKGRKSNNIDVSVQPEGFYFISKDGKTVEEVDLYYNTTTIKNIKITTTNNQTNITTRLKDEFIKVAAQEFVDSTRIYKTEYNKTYNYGLGVKIGTFAKMNLPHDLRLCYNNFTEYINALYGKGSTEKTISNDAGTKDNVIGSVGHWYAGYRLPASTKVVAKGTDINEAVKKNLFLTDGYILVKFDIKTKYQNNSGNYDYLQYMGPEAINEAGETTGNLIKDWTKEETQTIILPNGNQAIVPVGSVALYEGNLRSSNDAEVGGTH